MTTATIAPPNGNGYAVLLVMVILIGAIGCVVLWRTIGRLGREIDALKRRTGRGESRLKKLADFLKVVINDDRDDSPAVLAKAAPDDCPTDETPVAPPTQPDGIAIQVQSALLRPSPVPRGKSAEWIEAEIAAMRARNAERMARAITEEAS